MTTWKPKQGLLKTTDIGKTNQTSNVWSDWQADHKLSTEVLIVRDEERATKRWLISDEISWLKYGVKTAKRKNCGNMTWSAGEHDKNRNSSRLVSVDAIMLIYAKLCQHGACFSAAAVTRYPNVGHS